MDFLRRIFMPLKPSDKSISSKDKLPDSPNVNSPYSSIQSESEEATNVTATAELPHLSVQGATKPLAPEVVLSSTNNHISYGLTTDVGMVRTNNQDTLYAFASNMRGALNKPDFGLFIVADGMGGHHDGEKASALTVNTIATQLVQQLYLSILDDDSEEEHIPITESLVTALQRANANIIDKVPDGGTTATVVAIVNDLAYIVHVGDTRVYLVSNNEIEQLTRDHSLVQRLIELGQLTPEEAISHPQRNVLYRALGQNPHLEVDAITRRLTSSSRILICSDGLWNTVPEKTILDSMVQGNNPQSTCEKLVSVANIMGGSDNITAIVIYMPGA